MRNLKNYLTVILAFVFVGAFAQANTDVMKETKTNMYKVDKGDQTTTYQVHVITKEKQKVKLQKEDEGKLNQDRAKTPVEVSKTVTIDNYNANAHEIELSYYKSPDEELNFVATSNGLAIISDDNTMHHIDDKGVYMVYSDNDLDDIVIVEKFETMK